jgi:lysophospholipase L1-like esterase
METSWKILLLFTLVLFAASPAAAKRFMIMGDSIQAGTGLTDVTKLTSHQLETNANVVIHNFSSPGARMSNVGFFAGMTNDGPCVQRVSGFFGMQGVIIALGTNDWAGNTDFLTFFNDYVNLLDTIPPSLQVVCLTPLWRTNDGTTNAQGYTLDHYRFAAAVACASRGHAFLDGRQAIPNNAAYFADTVHPNEAGHTAMATFLQDELTALGWLP